MQRISSLKNTSRTSPKRRVAPHYGAARFVRVLRAKAKMIGFALRCALKNIRDHILKWQ